MGSMPQGLRCQLYILRVKVYRCLSSRVSCGLKAGYKWKFKHTHHKTMSTCLITKLSLLHSGLGLLGVSWVVLNGGKVSSLDGEKL